MATKIIIDSNIIIDALRKFPAAEYFIEKNIGNLFISVLTYVEVMTGSRNHKEEKTCLFLLENMEKLAVDEKIAELAGQIGAKYRKSHGTQAEDAIIAATAKIHNLPLATLNKKHFPMIRNLIIPYKKH